MSPGEVAASSIWRLMAAYQGYRKANGLDNKPDAPTEDEFEQAVARAMQ